MNGNGRDNIVIGLMVIFTYFLIDVHRYFLCGSGWTWSGVRISAKEDYNKIDGSTGVTRKFA